MANSIMGDVRKLAEASGHTQMMLGALTEVSQPTMVRFLGGADMRHANLCKLADALGYEIIMRKKRR